MSQHPDAAAAEKPDTPVKPWSVIAAMTTRLGDKDYPRGSLAALRRMDPDHPDGPAFIVLMLQAGAPDAWTTNEDGARAWGLIAHAMALMVPHLRGIRVGDALHEAEISEARVARLLTARGKQFRDQVSRLARRLAQAGQSLDWQELGGLILAEGRDTRDLDERRFRIARDFYSAQHKFQTSPPKEGS